MKWFSKLLGRTAQKASSSQNEGEKVISRLLPKAKDGVSIAAWIKAIRDADANAVSMLIKSGADVNVKLTDNGDTPLMAASGNGHVEIAKLLIENGADLNAKTNDGRTVLMIALIHEHPEAAELLIEKGSDVNAKDDILGRTALMIAARNGFEGVIELMIAKRADVNARDKKGGTAVTHATSWEHHTNIVRLLTRHGAKE